MPNDPPVPPLPPDQDPRPDGQILIYHDCTTHLQVRLEGQTVWLTQRLMADLYQVSVKTVNEHLINIYEEGELGKEATVRSFRIVQSEGTRDVARHLDHYNLDSIIAVGFRVRSPRGTAIHGLVTAECPQNYRKTPAFSLDFTPKRRYKSSHRIPVRRAARQHTSAGLFMRRLNLSGVAA